MGLRKQSIVGCSHELCFSVFRGAGACGVAKAIYKQFFSPFGPGLLVLIIIIIIIMMMMKKKRGGHYYSKQWMNYLTNLTLHLEFIH